MNYMMPKQFIKTVLIDEIGQVYGKLPYISFAMMAIGIEFLGKAINGIPDWNKSGRSQDDFELAINELNAFSSYKTHLKDYTLWTSLRNGFAHSFVPKSTLILSSGEKSKSQHLSVISNRLNLHCESFYIDFKTACEEVGVRVFSDLADKMNNPLLEISNSPNYFSGSTNN